MARLVARSMIARQLVLFGLAAMTACSAKSTNPSPQGSGGSGGTGGASSKGGSGGASASVGGASSPGGAVSTGGSTRGVGGGAGAAGGGAGVASVGGAPSAGGSTSTGGTAPDAGGGIAGDASRDATHADGASDVSAPSDSVDGAEDAPASGHWVGTWATAPMNMTGDGNPPSPGLAGNTLRQIVYVSIGGKQIRIRLDNSFGDGPLSIAAAHVAISKGSGAIETSTDRALTFSGSASATLGAGTVAFSDAVDFALSPLTSLAVTMVVDKVPGTVTGHVNSKSTSYLQSGKAVSAASLSSATGTLHWYFLSGVDVMADAASGSVVCIGDSTTEGDGWGDPDDVNQRWPDYLSRRLQANAQTKGVGVLNQGIGSNTVLAGSWGDSRGLPLVKRFAADVLAQSGVRWVVVIEGVNDIGNCPAGKGHDLALNIISAYKDLIAAAHAKGIRIYGGTIMPFGAASGYGQNNGQLNQDHIDAWNTVNDFIRTSGAFDGFIDFAKAIADPQRPDYVKNDYVTFDGLHPSTAGYQRMADAVDFALFSN